ncbi:MAG: hypothetical protein Q4D98_00045 [Planctomycetia bacterium]|nr:hypothetical protein [Planctomycetia bacterium]
MWIENPALSPLPAPVWFVLFFKVLGFVLHMVLMNLWMVGLPLALLLHWKGCPQGKLWGTRLIRQMPVIITFGVNFGIVPLLFIQLLYPRAFYPATILMAWHWIGIIALLIPAYYGTYLYVYAMAKEGTGIASWQRACGWISAIFFLIIGFFFVNGMVLTASPESWKEVWLARESSGATLGLGSAIRHATLFPRWVLMFGLALGTLSAWTLWDRTFFLGNQMPDYQKWSNGWTRMTAFFGAILFTLAGSHYIFVTLSPELRHAMFAMPLLPWTLFAAVMPWATAITVTWATSRRSRAFPAAVVVLAQLAALSANAISRQRLQILELNGFLPLSEIPVHTELGPMLLFLGTFVVGVAVILWMLYQAILSRES